MEKFNEEGITLDIITSLRFIDQTLDLEMVVEAENTTASTRLKGLANLGFEDILFGRNPWNF